MYIAAMFVLIFAPGIVVRIDNDFGQAAFMFVSMLVYGILLVISEKERR